MKRAALFSMLLLCLLLPASLGSCSARYTVTEEQLTTLETNLTQLKQDNEQLKAQLTQSQSELTKAQAQLKASQTECQTLRVQLTQLKDSSPPIFVCILSAMDMDDVKI